MLGKIKPDFQQNLFKTRLTELINMEHPLVKLAQEISWDKMEAEFETLISEQERPSVAIRKIAGMLLLKEMFKESDESVVERWIENAFGSILPGRPFSKPSSRSTRATLYTLEKESEKKEWSLCWGKASSCILKPRRRTRYR